MPPDEPSRSPRTHPGRSSWADRVLRLLGFGPRHGCGEHLTLDEELQIAFRASSDGDLPHAAHHLAGALQSDPCDPRVHQLLDRLVAKQQLAGGDPLELAPIGRKGTFSGTAALRACVLHRQGKPAEAVTLLRQVDHQDSKAPWWKLGAEWLQHPDVARASDPVQTVGLLLHGMSYFDTNERRDPDARHALEIILPAVSAVATAHRADVPARWLEAVVVRKLGQTERACELADALWKELPDYLTAICRAVARQCAGDVDVAARAYQDALRFKPEDSAARADLAELMAQDRRFEDALRWAEDAKEHDPNRETSAWMLAFLLRHRLTGDAAALQGLFDFSREHRNHRPPSQDALRVLGEYVTYIPPPQEATINVGRHLVAQRPEVEAGSSLRLKLSALESPSSRLALERTMARFNATLECIVESVAHPDPRVAWGPVEWVIWQYEDTTPRAALPGAGSQVVTLVAELALRPYDLYDWSTKAREVATQLTNTAVVQVPSSPYALAQDLLSVMTLPPPAPPDVDDWDWIRSVQVAAALIISAVDTGWKGSVRRLALESLIQGPVDWTTEAGLVAIMRVFEEVAMDEGAQNQIARLLADLARQVPDQGYCCFQNALIWACMRLPVALQCDLQDSFAPLWQQADD